MVAISNKQDFERKLEFTKKQIEYAENILRNYLLSNLKDEIIEFMILGNKSNVKICKESL